MKTKYIVVSTPLAFMEVAIVFSELLTHADMARSLGGTVLGAGFCYLENNQYVCYGHSTSLKINSRGEEDSKWLNAQLVKK